MNQTFDILATIAKNYKAKTPEPVKALDFHIGVCVVALIFCEFYRTVLKDNFNQSYNIAFLVAVGSFALTSRLIRLHPSSAFQRR